MLDMDSTIFIPSVPYIGPLPAPLQPGHIIKVSGTVASAANCFSINLQNGTNNGHRSDIALHLSPVFTSPPRLVRNSLENQSWGPEESHGTHFPFASDQGFEILILADTDHFKIAVNGQHFTEFQYRLPLANISHISVDGDVKVNVIKFEGLAKSPGNSDPSEIVTMPLGFVTPDSRHIAPPETSGRPPSPYDTSPTLPYPTSFGPSPTSHFPPSPTNNPYGPPPTSSPYGPPASSNPYGPPPGSNPYGPPPSSNPYGPPPTSNPYGPPHQSNVYPSGRVSPYGPPPSGGGYPSGGYPYGPPPGGNPYPQQSGAYPSTNPYPTQPGQYPGTSVVYPGQEKKSDGGMNLGPLAAAGAAALAGVAGSALMGGKHKKHKHKHGHGMSSMLGGHGAGPASLLSGVGSLLGNNKSHGHSGSSPIPIGGAMAGGAAALAGAYMLSKSPMGKIMKPKKMKKLYKHKHKGGGFGGFGSSSSSSSSSD